MVDNDALKKGTMKAPVAKSDDNLQLKKIVKLKTAEQQLPQSLVPWVVK